MNAPGFVGERGKYRAAIPRHKGKKRCQDSFPARLFLELGPLAPEKSPDTFFFDTFFFGGDPLAEQAVYYGKRSTLAG
jgi:hypothetical protein